MSGMPPFAILAGGLGTRLGALARDRPKAMVLVAGEPFVAHQLRLLRREGVERVVICVGHLAAEIRSFVGNGERFGIDVSYSEDGPAPLGTGGALRKALPLLGVEFAFLYGDSYLDTAYPPIVERFRKSDQPALMTAFCNFGQFDLSNVDYEDGRITRYDKRNPGNARYIDYGLSLLRSECLASWPADDPFDISDLFCSLSSAGRLAGFEASERFYEIGSPAGLAETEALLTGRHAS
jgi:NDP-sugar pyrophosphorylase family protein